jgi:beta-glucanase (GH16 family)
MAAADDSRRQAKEVGMRRTAWVAAAMVAACIWCGAAAAEEKATEKAPAFGPPGDPAEWVPLAAFTDEFNCPALDLAKWHPTNPKWKGRQPGYFSPANVAIADGELNITMKKETLPDAPKGYHTFTCGAVKSTAAVLYGFFEVKARAMNSRGSSAFWFYDDGPDRWTEIDVFEIGGGAPGHERKVHMNVHVFRTPLEPNRHWSKGGDWEAPFDLAADFHIYALEWDEREIKWYVDGVLRRTSENTHWHQPLYMNFDSETMPDWFGLPEDRQLPSTFSIEYVRAWQKKAGYPKVEGERPGPPAAGKK